MSGLAGHVPTDPVSGEKIRAQYFAELAAAVRRLAGLAGGPGILVQQTSLGVSISLAGASTEEWLPARIAAVYVDPSQSWPSSDVVYDVRIVGRPEIALVTGIKPAFGRPVDDSQGVRIFPARIDDLCWIIRRPGTGPDGTGVTAKLWVATEKIDFGACEGSPPGSPGTPGTQGSS